MSLDELPIGIEPVYPTPEINSPIELHRGGMTLSQDEASWEASGVIRYDWLPTPRFRFSATLSDRPSPFDIDLKACTLQIPGRHEVLKAIALSVQSSTSKPTEVAGILLRNEFDAGKRLSHVIFHVPNYYQYFGSGIRNTVGRKQRAGRICLEGGGWRITMDLAEYMDSTYYSSLQNSGGFAFTHVGRLERADEKPFSVKQARDIFQALSRFLSFSRGSWIAPILPIGYSRQGDKVWEEWAEWKVYPWMRVNTWFEREASSLREAFPGFLGRWLDVRWREPLELSIHWYVESVMSSGGVEGSIILVQAAFELLASTLLVEDKRVLSPEVFGPGRLSAANRLRLLLSACGIPLEIPPRLTELVRIRKPKVWADGPEAITEMRNALVHADPKKRKGLFKGPVGARYQAWELSLWYLELIILCLIGHRGKYANRMKQAEWSGQEIDEVPWAKNRPLFPLT